MRSRRRRCVFINSSTSLFLSPSAYAQLTAAMPYDFSFILLFLDFERYLYILEGFQLLVTGVLCYMTKDISGALNEARNNFTGNMRSSL
jgi:hypothetical protein